MSFPTKPAYVHAGSWDDELRSHPAMGWMEKYTDEVFDARAFDDDTFAAWHTPDFVFVKSDGTTGAPGKPSWELAKASYGPLVAQ